MGSVCFLPSSQRDAKNLKIRSDSPRFYPVEALAQGSTVGAIVGGVARVESEVGRNLESLTEDLKDNFKNDAVYVSRFDGDLQSLQNVTTGEHRLARFPIEGNNLSD